MGAMVLRGPPLFCVVEGVSARLVALSGYLIAPSDCPGCPGTFLGFWVRWFASLSVVCVIYSCCLVEVTNRIWGYGAAGSAPAWHAGGQGFESPYLHVFLG